MADTWIDQASPTQNKGSDSNLYVDSKSDSATMRTLVRFTLLTLASGCTLTGANLRLHNEAPTGGRTIDVYRAAATWNEHTVTWNSNVGTAGQAVASRPTRQRAGNSGPSPTRCRPSTARTSGS